MSVRLAVWHLNVSLLFLPDEIEWYCIDLAWLCIYRKYLLLSIFVQLLGIPDSMNPVRDNLHHNGLGLTNIPMILKV